MWINNMWIWNGSFHCKRSGNSDRFEILSRFTRNLWHPFHPSSTNWRPQSMDKANLLPQLSIQDVQQVINVCFVKFLFTQASNFTAYPARLRAGKPFYWRPETNPKRSLRDSEKERSLGSHYTFTRPWRSQRPVLRRTYSSDQDYSRLVSGRLREIVSMLN